eukprot:666943-Hanusia_phi.AAC.5
MPSTPSGSTQPLSPQSSKEPKSISSTSSRARSPTPNPATRTELKGLRFALLADEVAGDVLRGLRDGDAEQARVVHPEHHGLQRLVVDAVAQAGHAEADADELAGEVVDVDHAVVVAGGEEHPVARDVLERHDDALHLAHEDGVDVGDADLDPDALARLRVPDLHLVVPLLVEPPALRVADDLAELAGDAVFVEGLVQLARLAVDSHQALGYDPGGCAAPAGQEGVDDRLPPPVARLDPHEQESPVGRHEHVEVAAVLVEVDVAGRGVAALEVEDDLLVVFDADGLVGEADPVDHALRQAHHAPADGGLLLVEGGERRRLALHLGPHPVPLDVHRAVEEDGGEVGPGLALHPRADPAPHVVELHHGDRPAGPVDPRDAPRHGELDGPGGGVPLLQLVEDVGVLRLEDGRGEDERDHVHRQDAGVAAHVHQVEDVGVAVPLVAELRVQRQVLPAGRHQREVYAQRLQHVGELHLLRVEDRLQAHAVELLGVEELREELRRDELAAEAEAGEGVLDLGEHHQEGLHRAPDVPPAADLGAGLPARLRDPGPHLLLLLRAGVGEECQVRDEVAPALRLAVVLRRGEVGVHLRRIRVPRLVRVQVAQEDEVAHPAGDPVPQPRHRPALLRRDARDRVDAPRVHHPHEQGEAVAPGEAQHPDRAAEHDVHEAVVGDVGDARRQQRVDAHVRDRDVEGAGVADDRLLQHPPHHQQLHVHGDRVRQHQALLLADEAVLLVDVGAQERLQQPEEDRVDLVEYYPRDAAALVAEEAHPAQRHQLRDAHREVLDDEEGRVLFRPRQVEVGGLLALAAGLREQVVHAVLEGEARRGGGDHLHELVADALLRALLRRYLERHAGVVGGRLEEPYPGCEGEHVTHLVLLLVGRHQHDPWLLQLHQLLVEVLPGLDAFRLLRAGLAQEVLRLAGVVDELVAVLAVEDELAVLTQRHGVLGVRLAVVLERQRQAHALHLAVGVVGAARHGFRRAQPHQQVGGRQHLLEADLREVEAGAVPLARRHAEQLGLALVLDQQLALACRVDQHDRGAPGGLPRQREADGVGEEQPEQVHVGAPQAEDAIQLHHHPLQRHEPGLPAAEPHAPARLYHAVELLVHRLLHLLALRQRLVQLDQPALHRGLGRERLLVEAVDDEVGRRDERRVLLALQRDVHHHRVHPVRRLLLAYRPHVRLLHLGGGDAALLLHVGQHVVHPPPLRRLHPPQERHGAAHRGDLLPERARGVQARVAEHAEERGEDAVARDVRRRQPLPRPVLVQVDAVGE